MSVIVFDVILTFAHADATYQQKIGPHLEQNFFSDNVLVVFSKKEYNFVQKTKLEKITRKVFEGTECEALKYVSATLWLNTEVLFG